MTIDVSGLDATKPEALIPTTASVRANFAAAKAALVDAQAQLTAQAARIAALEAAPGAAGVRCKKLRIDINSMNTGGAFWSLIELRAMRDGCPIRCSYSGDAGKAGLLIGSLVTDVTTDTFTAASTAPQIFIDFGRMVTVDELIIVHKVAGVTSSPSSMTIGTIDETNTYTALKTITGKTDWSASRDAPARIALP